MKKTNYMLILLLGLACLAASMNANAQVNDESIMTASFSNPSQKGHVKITWRNGDVLIREYSGTEVKVEFLNKKRKSREDVERARGLKRIFGGDAVEVSEANNVITISSHSTMRNVDAEISIPRNADVNFENSLNGDVTVDGFSGEIEVQTLNGEITLKDMSGPVSAYSINGAIAAIFKTVYEDSPMSFSTVNSDIDIEMPSTVKASLKMSTNDEIYTDFDVQKSVDTRERRSRSRKTYYEINGGGIIIEITTIHGSIYIRKGL